MMNVAILGTAHGKNVGGKRSPDGKFEEYQYSREIVGLLRKELSALGFIVHVDMMQSEVPLPQTAESLCRPDRSLSSQYPRVFLSVCQYPCGCCWQQWQVA